MRNFVVMSDEALSEQWVQTDVHPEFFLAPGGLGDLETVYNLCLILKIVIKIML
jgi:hypothetical protein